MMNSNDYSALRSALGDRYVLNKTIILMKEEVRIEYTTEPCSHASWLAAVQRHGREIWEALIISDEVKHGIIQGIMAEHGRTISYNSSAAEIIVNQQWASLPSVTLIDDPVVGLSTE